MDFRSTTFWLFWLTLLSMHHNQLNTDGCFGAALLQQHYQLQQISAIGRTGTAGTEIATENELNNLKANAIINTEVSDAGRFQGKRKQKTKTDDAGTKLKIPNTTPAVIGAIEPNTENSETTTSTTTTSATAATTIDTRTLTIKATTTATATATKWLNDKENVQHLKNAKNFKNPKNSKSSKNVHFPENFALDFKENMAKLFASDAPFKKYGNTLNRTWTESSSAATIGIALPGAAIATATATPPAAVPAPTINTNGSNNSSTSTATHFSGRRHIIPEKLLYTKEISLKQGRLKGIIRRFNTSTGLRDVDQYLGLPFAEAPVGSRRFMPPGTPLPWQDLKIARHLPPVCPQKLPDINPQGGVKMASGRYSYLQRLLPYLKTESEDCLYLNVYVPHNDGLRQTQAYPVLVYVHGESFEWNSGNPYDGSVLASYGEVIVVTINYRLGVMGFLKPSTNENSVANFGLLDQVAALHWIKENIAVFGGDMDSVTLMGHSTGAACVNYLMVSPVAAGLFHRAILMSGSAMSDWAANNHSLQLTMLIANHLNCPLNDDNEQMLSCLREQRYENIQKIPTSFSQFSTTLGPIVDGHVIPDQPYKVMGQYTEHFSRYDLLFGVTESESYHTLGALALKEGLRENERDNLLRFYMQSRFDVRPDLALAATLNKYNDMYNNPIKATNLEHRDVVLDILSDARVVGPLMQTGLFHADVNRRNYMYVFGHNSAKGPYASVSKEVMDIYAALCMPRIKQLKTYMLSLLFMQKFASDVFKMLVLI
ncbi:neuroligin-3-like [Teleopsis dalmanni]|uniref:neuroligin-3-like n=1 Tax=Teleopsis dalmanni TaxID=139649 RepID=UPI0018CE4BBC|nr:neuroligin-3-like [Teleopsis dalmanni]